jgi:hypothetical protein
MTIQLAGVLFSVGLLAFYLLTTAIVSALWGAVARWRGR